MNTIGGILGDCVTVTTTELIPGAENVTFATLELVVVLALLVVTVIVPLPEPDADDKLSQVASSVTAQFVFEATLKVPVDPDVELTVILGGAIDKVGIILLVQRTENPNVFSLIFAETLALVLLILRYNG